MSHNVKRRALAQQLRWLVIGRITNAEFDDFLYDENLFVSQDTAIATIAEWAGTLYSDISTYRLRGRHTVSDEVRRTVARAIVLLRSDCDYRWPVSKPLPWAAFLESVTWLCVPLGGALAIIALLLGMNDVRWVGNGSALLVCLGWLSSIFTLWSVSRYTARELRRSHEEAFKTAGDLDYWPFLSKQDLENAARRGHLLAK